MDDTVDTTAVCIPERLEPNRIVNPFRMRRVLQCILVLLAVTFFAYIEWENYLERKAVPSLSFLRSMNFLTPAELKRKMHEELEINGRFAEEATPLMYAAELNNVEVARLLVQAGARTDLFDEKGRTALGIARQNRSKDVEAYLVGIHAP